MAEDSHTAEDRLAQTLYERMHGRGEALLDAAEGLGLGEAEVEAGRVRLERLGLLNPEDQTTVDGAAALRRRLASSHRILDKLVEQHVMTASLARDYLGVVHRNPADIRTEFYERSDYRAVQQRLDELAELARHEVMEMHPAAVWPEESLKRGESWAGLIIGRGLRLRTIHAQVMLADPLVREHLRTRIAQGVEVKAAPVIPTRMLIFDRQVALIQADPESLAAGAVVIQGDTIVPSLAALYDYCWMTASEPEDVPRSADSTVLTDQQHAVLRLLATGAKDNAIARSLGVSTRTVTRVVGELTTMLGAASRFQAGVRAARLGWLD